MIDVGWGDVFFACDECGIHEQIENRLINACKFGYAFQFDHCSCEKVGDEFFSAGYCEDAFIRLERRRNAGVRKTGRLFRREMYRKKRSRGLQIKQWKLNAANTKNSK